VSAIAALAPRASFALETKTLSRDYEPVVGTAEELQVDGLIGKTVAGFAAYRYTAAADSWAQIPLQVDQKWYRDFGQEVECQGSQPACACGPTNTCHLCEMTYVWDGESDPDDGGAGAVLDPNDEIVFLAKDTGDEAPGYSYPSGLGGQSRYRVKVGHPDSGYGWVYLYWLASGAPAVAPYVTVSATGSGATQQTTFKVCDHPLLSGFDAYQIGLKGNWSLNELRVDTAGTTANCNVTYSSLDVLDRAKWRLSGETDETWNDTSEHKGTIAGRVRVVRGSLGAASGFGTTHYYHFYPTWFVDETHLRVHHLSSAIQGYIDWTRASTNQGNQLCPVPNFDFRRITQTNVQDYVDGGCAPPFAASAFEARQLNGPYVSLVELAVEDPEHPIPSVNKAMLYDDNAGAPLETGLEDEAGAYGNVGVSFGNTNSTQEDDCNEVKYARLSRIWQVKSSDSGKDRASNLSDDVRFRPLEIVSGTECPGCGGGGPPPTPCKPTVSANDPGVGYYASLSIGSPCGTSGLWFRAYRSVGTSGPFDPLASLRTATAFKDYRVERGQTYRYYVESYNAGGQTSTPSDTATVTVTDTVPPAAVVITGSASGSFGTLSWEWTKDFDLAGYHVYRATQSGGPYTKLTIGGSIREKEYSGQLQPAGTTYYFVVKAVDAGGLESTASNEVALTGQ